ncbi:BCCT family transporter [Streptomonospora halophila]|uniref:BCCT family transporter n=1 Tax=Streptomonospora halophila TaxID=427369 RepID=A0ABP9GP67_9ACTN
MNAVIMFVLVGWGVVSKDTLASSAQTALDWLLRNTGWGLVLATTAFVVFVVWLAVSRYGRIPLGKDGEEPEFRTVSWIAMMFSAGMGIGLMFFGVSEPLTHFVKPPPGTVDGGSEAAIETAMATTLFHWTLHPWSIYAVVGLAIAYASFRRGRTQLISSVFAPLLGRSSAAGPVGKLIDILALFATLFGSAASLGIGTLQIRSGMQESGWIDSASNTVLVVIIVVLTICFVISAVSGVSRGIQWLSNTNMVLAGLLAVFVFVMGPTVFMLNLVPTSIGSYIADFGDMASRSGATGGREMDKWLGTWTVFYWAWWISWTPFVGMFIARISRGRTIRQFITGVLLVPSTVSVVWFSIFGGASIDLQRDGADVFGAGEAEAQAFAVLEHLPLTGITTVIVMVLVAIFFVSGADAASIVMGTLSQRGTIEPRRTVVIFWGAATGAVAAIMLIAGGKDALSGIENLTFLGALPFALVMVLLCVSLMKDLRSDPMMLLDNKRVEVVEAAVQQGVDEHEGEFRFDISPTIDDDGGASEPGGSPGPKGSSG